MSGKTVPITRLELWSIKIPRGPLVVILEHQAGCPITHEHPHYLAGQPVHCGDLLELYWNDEWILGRYEWTAVLDELPTFESGKSVVRLDEGHLLRWRDQTVGGVGKKPGLQGNAQIDNGRHEPTSEHDFRPKDGGCLTRVVARWRVR